MKKEKDVVLFLDYDGVLHRGGALVDRQTGTIRSEAFIYTLFEFESLLATALEGYPSVKIVLSTSWTYQPGGLQESMSRLSDTLKAMVIGTTFHDSGLDAEIWCRIPRGEQVKQYVARHQLQSDRWIALDDREDGFEDCRDNLVKTYEFAGLGDLSVLRMLYAKLEAWKSLESPATRCIARGTTPAGESLGVSRLTWSPNDGS